MIVADSLFRFWIRFFLPFFLGKKPSKIKRSVGSPDETNAARKADGPGTDSTVESIAIASRTSLYAGSEMPGVPASVTTARFFPEVKCLINFGILENLLCSK